ncbi:hypothetical protein Tco_1010071 [Tanacetum coccineum]
MTEVVDVENWRIDNSRVLRWVVSLIEWNSFVFSTKSSIQITFRFIVVSTDSSSSIPADNVPAGSSSSIPAEYVFAGHVLVSADRDRIC